MAAMTKEEREAFLSELHVGVLSIPEEGRGPLTVPVWYSYEAGEVRISMGKVTRKAQLLKFAGRVSFCVQIETSPYRYVSIEGPVIGMEPVDLERELRPLARRYLGAEGGDQWVTGYIDRVNRDPNASEILVRIRPERWLTVDYSK